MKKIFTTILMAMVTMTTWAYDVEVDGIYYNLNTTDKTATVTYKTTDYNSYSSSVNIPESITSGGITYAVTSIGSCAFRDCVCLSSVTIPNSITGIGLLAFYNCSGLTSVYIPNSVTNIGTRAFESCKALTSVIIPNSLLIVREATFYGCVSLISVTISNSVKNIGEAAFYKCSKLTSVYNYATTPQILQSDNDFTNSANCTLYVPKGSIETYETADYWKDFKEIKEMETTAIDNVNVTSSITGATQYYQINGTQNTGLQKGLNIFKTQDSVKKVIVK